MLFVFAYYGHALSYWPRYHLINRPNIEHDGLKFNDINNKTPNVATLRGLTVPNTNMFTLYLSTLHFVFFIYKFTFNKVSLGTF